MADRGRGGGRRGRGRSRGFSIVPQITNPSTSSIHTSESITHVVAPTPNTLPIAHGQSNPAVVSESTPTTPVVCHSPSTPHDSFTPEFPPDPNSEHIAEPRPFIRAYKGEFQPPHACSNAISAIIRAKFEEPAPTWLKVSVQLRDRWFGEFKKQYAWDSTEERAIRVIFETKGSRILKNAMNKIRTSQDKGTWMSPTVQANLAQYWTSSSLLNKSSIAKANRAADGGASAYCGGSISTASHFEKLSKEFQRPPPAWEVMSKTKKLKSGEWVNDKSRQIADKYQQCRDEILQHSTKGGASQDSPNTSDSVNDNEIYLNVVGGANRKGNLYGLGTLSKRFNSEKSSPSNIVAPVEDQIEQMRETINKLNAEIEAKADKERTLEQKVLQLMENHDQQSQQIRLQNEQMQRIIQHLNINSHMPPPSPQSATADGIEQNDDDHDMDH